MTTSELLLSKIALRLAVVVVLGLVGHLPDQRRQPLTAQADAIEMSAASSRPSALENQTNAAAGYTD